MPTVRKRYRTRNGKRTAHWQVIGRQKGYPTFSKVFPEGTPKRDALAWGSEEERKQLLGDVPTLKRKEWQGERWSRLSEQIFRIDKWSLCRGQAAKRSGSGVK